MEPVNAFFFGLLALAAGGAAWWMHRARLADMRRQLREAQDSQLEFAEVAAKLHRRLVEAEADQAPGGADGAHRRAALERALAAAAPAQSNWEDTHPLTVPGFMETQPAGLDDAREHRR